MSNQRDRNRFPFGLIVGVALALAVAGGGLAWWSSKKSHPTSSTVTPQPTASQPVIEASPSPTESVITEKPSQTQTIKVYWLKVSSEKTELQPVAINIQKSSNKSELLTNAFNNLLAEPSDSNYTTGLSQGTKLLGLKVDQEGVHVNLSQEFTTNNGAALIIGRLAQVIYTASSLDPSAPVWISVEGKPLELLGEGEGIIVDQPMTRKSFSKNYQL
jgi:spore germination protein GerM